ncbi:hypothetical protein [Mesorhizobium sp. M1E.F.Ca.ET.041.01.1.1]|uniref:hypothetical protein n=1 Tax=Mesorhizobium sp. M1E.F.Ca.ET.041.01.1.1 TaxID=2496759 RepID=UPI001675BFD6|nr:hypothetical protein [Mesorhizobium sp. M1E.F.Ca.ET.041.01.1.1]
MGGGIIAATLVDVAERRARQKMDGAHHGADQPLDIDMGSADRTMDEFDAIFLSAPLQGARSETGWERSRAAFEPSRALVSSTGSMASIRAFSACQDGARTPRERQSPRISFVQSMDAWFLARLVKVPERFGDYRSVSSGNRRLPCLVPPGRGSSELVTGCSR